MKLKFVDYGVANNFGDYIEMHRDLQKDPILYNFILEHEMNHSDKFFSFHDLFIDLFNYNHTWRMFRFMIVRPKTWIQFSPLYKTKKGFFWDVNLTIIYALELMIISLIVFLIMKFL